MSTFKGIIATDHVFSVFSDGIKFSPECLRRLAESGPELPVTCNYNPDHIVGTVVSTEMTEKGVMAVIRLDDALIKAYPHLVASGYVRQSHGHNGVVVIDEFDMMEVSLVESPADTSLPRIEKVEE